MKNHLNSIKPVQKKEVGGRPELQTQEEKSKRREITSKLHLLTNNDSFRGERSDT